MPVATKSPLSIDLEENAAETIIRFRGRLDGSLSQSDRERVIAKAKAGSHLVLNFSELTEISAIGMRMLLTLARIVREVGGTIAGVGVPERLRDLAESAGFSQLFSRNPETIRNLAIGRPRTHVDAYPTHQHAGFAIGRGAPLPFGATLRAGGVNFSVFSRHATGCTLVLFKPGKPEPMAEIPFPPEFRLGDVFAMTVFDLDAESVEYGFRMEGPFDPAQGHRFDSSQVLLDPYAQSIAGLEAWGSARGGSARGGSSSKPALRGQILPDDFDWEDDRPLNRPIESLVIYEMHVRGFTQDPSSGVKHPGTYTGLREKIAYLKELGVNCVELLPVYEFDELENPRKHPRTGEPLVNYWGYSTIGFFAPKAAYAATGPAGMQADEFKFLVKELHRAGIEVILDVVYNHTAEGNENGPLISFRGIDNRTYYMLSYDGNYYNFSGCGNTLNCNHPAVRGFVIESLRHWVTNYHIDGFRFDLASILGRGQNGAPLANPPLLEALAGDPILGKTKLIAEAWDAGGLYQVGSFPEYGRWAEWNGRYRDCVRKFLKGDPGQISEMATRLMGSADLYGSRAMTASVNFITCHDGFTLADLVSYNGKHNEENGEENRDGANDNHSWNCGAEGVTNDPAINELRRRQIKNALAILLVSRGIPMILMGDECGHTQGGNNNTYCHDGPINWMDWKLVRDNAELLRFCRLMIQFRQQHAVAPTATAGLEISWHGTRAWQADWSSDNRLLAWMRRSQEQAHVDAVYAAMNMHWETHHVEAPEPPAGRRWHVAVNTAQPSPQDIWEKGKEPPLADRNRVLVAARSIVILVAR